ncbi:hypothetical protein TELCIR_18348 [Teladorsagia circumcincta]|uniref:Ribosomal protein S21 n=1 Tax=Teladorsagia circumcincta TaxID=45464 RepID=A0A2G9TQ76_TELCI|nr:hypothetical protein TELCIR_18348 [Teladorsagia circumcincta]
MFLQEAYLSNSTKGHGKNFPGKGTSGNVFRKRDGEALAWDVDAAVCCQNVLRLMDAEGLLKIIRRTQFYQKPWMQRKQLSVEASCAIFNEDMTRKMQFLMRKNRPDAHPGQITT